MTKPSDETEMFRMNLAWEDEEEVVVKLEPVDSPIVPRVGNERDLVPNEEWTRDEDIHRRSYTNKRLKISTEVKEITFRIEDSPKKEKERLLARLPPVSFAAKSNIVGATEDYVDISEGLTLSVVKETTAVAPSSIVKQPLTYPVKAKAKESQALGTATKIVVSPPNVKKPEASSVRVLPNRSAKRSVASPVKIVVPPTTVKRPVACPVKVVAANVSTKQLVASPSCLPMRGIVLPKQGSVTNPPPLPTKLQKLSVCIPTNSKQVTAPVAIDATSSKANKPVASETSAKPRIVAMLRNNSPGNVLFLTPVSKAVVMRSKSAVRLLTEEAVVKPAPTPPAPKLPIYLRKIPEPPKPDRIKPATNEISYTGIYSSSTEPIKWRNKHGVDESNEPRANWLQTAQDFWKIPKPKTTKKNPQKQPELNQETVHRCTVCTKTFTKKKHLNVHSKIHNSEKRAPTKPCPECDKLFCDNSQLRIHMRVHTGDRPYSCPLCHKRFKHLTSLTRHHMFHTKERPFACETCPKTYRIKGDLVNHMRVHTDERPYACKYCGKRFKDRCANNTHERIHRDKKYKCNVCLRVFTQSATLRGHMVTHTEERPFSCVLCDMKFKSKSVLRSHERVHTAGKTFKCEFCDLLFTEKRTLARHAYTHKEKEKPFPCSFCKRWYFRQERYLAHINTHNMQERPFKCAKCHKCYASEGYLKLHMTKAHGVGPKEYACKFMGCGQKFPRLIQLTRHLVVHGDLFIFECDICRKRFGKKKTLQMHLIKVHNFASCFTCSKCHKTFIRKAVLERHIASKCS